MSQKTVWGYISSSGDIKTQSGDISSVTQQKTTGFYDVVLKDGTYNKTPAITGSCVSDGSEAPVFQVYSVNGNNAYTFLTRDAHSGDKDWRAFMFIAVGDTDD